MPPACPVDCYVRRYIRRTPRSPECHRLARWIVTFAATSGEHHALPNATGLPGGSLRLPLRGVRLHRASRWHPSGQQSSVSSERNDPQGKPGAFAHLFSSGM